MKKKKTNFRPPSDIKPLLPKDKKKKKNITVSKAEPKTESIYAWQGGRCSPK